MKLTYLTRKLLHPIVLLLAGFAVNSPVWADSALESVNGFASGTPISTRLFSLGGNGITSISFDSAPPVATLAASQGPVSRFNGSWLSNYTYHADGSVASYLRQQYTDSAQHSEFNTNFTLSANTLALFETTATTAGNFQTCGSFFGCLLDRNGPESGYASGWATLQVSGTGYHGTASQSATASQETHISVEDQSSTLNGGCVSCTSSRGTGANHGYLSGVDPVTGPYLDGEYWFTDGLLSVAFLNLTDATLTGHLEFGVGTNVRTYGESVLTTVPVPASAWLLGSGLLGLVGVARRKPSAS